MNQKEKSTTSTVIQKILHQLGSPSLLTRYIDEMRFPERPIPRLFSWAKMRSLATELRRRTTDYTIGSLYTPPHTIATRAYKKFIADNPGNLGTWSDKKNISSTQKIESEVIHKIIDLYHGAQQSISGYITSGGTEGNMYSAWVGRSYLRQYHDLAAICLIKTNLTHYSIQKAAHICAIEEYTTPLHPQTWNMDPNGLSITIQRLYKKGYRGFLIPLTIGYTTTGTSDDIETITRTLAVMKKSYPDINIYVWIDAALNGLIEPFINPSFTPFDYPFVQSLVLDFHKVGLVPYTAGVVLYRRVVRQYIEKPIDYLSENDTTLLGSRSGIPAISIWQMIHSFGKKGYRDMIRNHIHIKNTFISRVTASSKQFEFVTHENSISCGLIYHHGTNRLPKWLENKYNLYLGKTTVHFMHNRPKEIAIYKCFFLPHVSMRVALEFAADLLSVHAVTT